MKNKGKSNSLWMVGVAIVALVFLGLSIMTRGSYGSDFLCARVGGLWCYSPPWGALFFNLLIIVIVVSAVVWFVKKMQKR